MGLPYIATGFNPLAHQVLDLLFKQLRERTEMHLKVKKIELKGPIILMTSY